MTIETACFILLCMIVGIIIFLVWWVNHLEKELRKYKKIMTMYNRKKQADMDCAENDLSFKIKRLEELHDGHSRIIQSINKRNSAVEKEIAMLHKRDNKIIDITKELRGKINTELIEWDKLVGIENIISDDTTKE